MSTQNISGVFNICSCWGLKDVVLSARGEDEAAIMLAAEDAGPDDLPAVVDLLGAFKNPLALLWDQFVQVHQGLPNHIHARSPAASRANPTISPLSFMARASA